LRCLQCRASGRTANVITCLRRVSTKQRTLLDHAHSVKHASFCSSKHYVTTAPVPHSFSPPLCSLPRTNTALPTARRWLYRKQRQFCECPSFTRSPDTAAAAVSQFAGALPSIHYAVDHAHTSPYKCHCQSVCDTDNYQSINQSQFLLWPEK